MSTRSRIAILNADKSIDSIYCHFDGYIKGGVGECLYYNYTSENQIRDLIALGDVSMLRPTLETSVFYGRDRDEDLHRITFEDWEDLLLFFKKSDQEYLYVFDPQESCWTVTTRTFNLVPLSEYFLSEDLDKPEILADTISQVEAPITFTEFERVMNYVISENKMNLEIQAVYKKYQNVVLDEIRPIYFSSNIILELLEKLFKLPVDSTGYTVLTWWAYTCDFGTNKSLLKKFENTDLPENHRYRHPSMNTLRDLYDYMVWEFVLYNKVK